MLVLESTKCFKSTLPASQMLRESDMLESYLPIAILLIVASVVCLLLVAVGTIFGPRRKSFRKGTAYESGMQPIGPGTRVDPAAESADCTTTSGF